MLASTWRQSCWSSFRRSTRFRGKEINNSRITCCQISKPLLRRLCFNSTNTSQFSTSALAQCSDRFYTKSHEWLTVEGSIGTVGISNHAQEALGDIVYVELPDVEKDVKQGDEVANLESVKATSAVMTPVSGKVVEKNEQVEKEPSLLNNSPYELGWLFKLELSKRDEELPSLMDTAAYEKMLEESKDD